MFSFVTGQRRTWYIQVALALLRLTEIQWQTALFGFNSTICPACISQLSAWDSLMFLLDLHTGGSAGCLGSSLLPEDKIRKTLTSHPAVITIVRFRHPAWVGFMFSNLPNNLLTGRLKQTTTQSATPPTTQSIPGYHSHQRTSQHQSGNFPEHWWHSRLERRLSWSKDD